MLFALTLVSALLGSPDAPQAPPSSGRAELTGASSPLIASLCVPADPPGGDALRCAALPGIDLFLKGPPERRRVSLGTPDGFIPPPPEPTNLSSTARWRLLGDRPLAAILRYTLPEAPDEVLFVVVKAPSGGAPSCLAMILAGQAGGESAEADALADERAATFRCGVDRPSFTGPRAGEALRRAGLAWLASP